MQCEEVREQFADYVIDSVQEPVRFQIAQHLKGCEACRSEAEELKTLWMSLASIPAVQPGPELRARFDVMLEAYRHGLDHAASISLWQRLNSWIGAWWPRQPVFQFGAAVALLAIGITAGLVSRPAPVPQTTNEVAQLRGEVSEMRQLVALSLMQQQSASDRLRGVNWSYQMQQPGNEILTALLDMLTHDPNVNLRLATVDALRQFGDQPVVRRGVVDAMGRQQSPMVQIALIDLAVDLKEKESVPLLRQLTQDEKLETTVRQRAQKGLTELE